MTENVAHTRVFRYQKQLSFLFQAVILGLLAVYFYRNQSVFQSLRNIRWSDVALLVLLDTAAFLVSSYLNFTMIRQMGARVSFWDNLLLQYANSMFNKILPTIGGGAAFRAIFLKKKYHFPYTQFISTVAGVYVISFLSTAATAIVCMLIIYAQQRVFNGVLFLIFAGIFLAVLVMIIFSPQVPNRNGRIFRVLRSVIAGWNILKQSPQLVLRYTLLSFLLLFLTTGSIFVSYQALGVTTHLIPMLLLSCLGIVLAFLNFTPDAIGVKEGVYLFSAALVQMPGDVLVLGSLVLRGASMATTFLFGGLSYWLLMRQMQSMDTAASEPPPQAGEEHPRS